MVTQLQESQRQMSDALAICKSAIETNNPTIVSDYTLKLEPEFREIKTALDKKDVSVNASCLCSLQVDLLASTDISKTNYSQEKPTELSTTESAYHSNAQTTGNDPFGANGGPSTIGGFASNFGTTSNGGGGGFDDSFGSAFGGQTSRRNDDPFHGGGGNATASAPAAADPFGDKAGVNKAVTPDVCVCFLSRRCRVGAISYDHLRLL